MAFTRARASALLQSRASRFVCAGFTAGFALTSSTSARADEPPTLSIPDPDEGLVVVERSHDPQWNLGRGFETECTTPCTLTLDRTAAYRVTGPRFEATPPLKLSDAMSNQVLEVRPTAPTRTRRIVGWSMILFGSLLESLAFTAMLDELTREHDGTPRARAAAVGLAVAPVIVISGVVVALVGGSRLELRARSE